MLEEVFNSIRLSLDPPFYGHMVLLVQGPVTKQQHTHYRTCKFSSYSTMGLVLNMIYNGGVVFQLNALTSWPNVIVLWGLSHLQCHNSSSGLTGGFIV